MPITDSESLHDTMDTPVGAFSLVNPAPHSGWIPEDVTHCNFGLIHDLYQFQRCNIGIICALNQRDRLVELT